MALQALRCRVSASDDDALALTLWGGTLDELCGERTPTVYLLRRDALGTLRHRPELFNDRGVKHAAVPLAKLLLGRVRTPLVAAGFRSGRQVARSLRALLCQAGDRGERKAYVVGLPDAVFDELAAKAVPESSTAVIRSREPGAGQEVAEALYDSLLETEAEPAALRERLVGDSPEMCTVRRWVVRASRHVEPVLILGDTGTGKEVVARSIHDLDEKRRGRPFVPINCGAISRELFESELFGHVPGAFTGALRGGRVGWWRQADGGTLFLDEVGDLAPEHQVKVLRALETRKVRPVGGDTEVPVGARVVAATNRDLYQMVEAGTFREDLFYRLNSFIIRLPRLSDHREDVSALAAHFWAELAPGRPPLSQEALRELSRGRWRGNARELRSVLSCLHTSFQKVEPGAMHVRAVMREQARWGGRQGPVGPEAEALYRVECLRYLRRARETIEIGRRAMRTFKGGDRSTVEAVVGRSVLELRLLAGHPEFLASPRIVDLVRHLEAQLTALQSLLAEGGPAALRLCQKELATELADASTRVQRQIDQVVRLL